MYLPQALKVLAVLKESDDATIIKAILMTLAKIFPINIMRNKYFYVCMHFYEYLLTYSMQQSPS